MSIASEITRLSGVRSDIFTSITNKGVTVPATATFSSCPALIDSITGGGGGSPTSLINTSFTASGYLSAYRPFTATQIPTEEYEYDYVVSSLGSPTGVQNDMAYIPISLDYITGVSAQSYVWTLFGFVLSNANDNPYQVYFGPTPNTQTAVGNARFQQTGASEYFVYEPWSDLRQIWMHYSANWQWSVQNNQIYCQVRSPWYQANQYSITNQEMSGQILTGTTTALPYPTYSETTTGYVENTVSSIEYWDNGTAKLSAYVIRNYVYDDSPSDTTASDSSTENITTFSSNVMKNWDGTFINLNGNDLNYTYSYDTSASGYSGFEGV